jgi:hypothetical protein
MSLKKPPLDRYCKCCGNLFHPKRKRINAGGGLFCSNTCVGEYNTTLRTVSRSDNLKNRRIHNLCQKQAMDKGKEVG